MRLRTHQQYQRVIRNRFQFTGQWILVDICLTRGPFSRLGITVTKRYGQAPQRNRFKRLAREAFRLSYAQFHHSIDVILRPRSRSAHASMKDIQQELLFFIEKVHRHSDESSKIEIDNCVR